MEPGKKLDDSAIYLKNSETETEGSSDLDWQRNDSTETETPSISTQITTTTFEGHHVSSELLIPQTNLHASAALTKVALAFNPFSDNAKDNSKSISITADAESTSTSNLLRKKDKSVNADLDPKKSLKNKNVGVGGGNPNSGSGKEYSDSQSSEFFGSNSGFNNSILELIQLQHQLPGPGPPRKKWLTRDTFPNVPSSIFVYHTEGEGRGRATERGVSFGYKQELYKEQGGRHLRPRLLIVENDDGMDENIDFHMRALDKRISRDNLEALEILKTMQTPSSTSILMEFDNRERYYRRKQLIAWKAALSMPRTKKLPFPTEIPVAATHHMKKSLRTVERLRRYIRKGFHCGKNRLYVDEVLTQRSVDDFNYTDKYLRQIHILPGFGLQRRMRLFAMNLPKAAEHDDDFVQS